MTLSNRKAHLASALRWSTETKVDKAAILGSGIAMAGPVLLGGALGDLPLGLAASLGGLMVGGIAAGAGWRTQLHRTLAAAGPAVAAALAAASIAGHGWLTAAMLVVLVGVVAVGGGYSRPLAVAATRFVPYLIIAFSVAEAMPTRLGLVLLILVGTAWAALVGAVLAAVARAHRGRGSEEAADSKPQTTAAQRFARWRRTLAHLSGWQYALRLSLCIAVAAALNRLWPDHHLYWVALTAALLVERKIETFPVRVTQRGVGTALGVLAAGLLLAYKPPFWGLAAGIGVLAGARTLLRSRNYLAYSVVMTLLIIVIMDAGRPLGIGVLVDRLVATLIGAALVIGANLIFGKLIGPPASDLGPHGRRPKETSDLRGGAAPRVSVITALNHRARPPGM